MLVPGGELTAETAPLLSARLSELIDLHKRRHVTVDLHLVGALDPAAVEVLVHASCWLSQLGGTLAVEHAPVAGEAALADRLAAVAAHAAGAA